MGDSWRELVEDPVVRDLRAVVTSGIHDISVERLKVLPTLFSDGEGPADEATIRACLLNYLMVDDPEKKPWHKDLGQATQFGLALFGATSETKIKRVGGRREIAGQIYKPDAPISAEGIRKGPSARQPRGGLEWRLMANLRRRILADHAPFDPSPSASANGDGASDTGDDEAPLHPPVPGSDVRRLGDMVRSEIADRYTPVKEEDFTQSFFHRQSTDGYIEQIAALPGVTLYTGAGVSADVHAPMRDELMAWSLEERLRAETDLTEAQRDRIVGALAQAYPPTYLGSIAREFVRQHSDYDRFDLEALELEARNVLAQDFRNALRAGRDTGGFLALGLGTLAFALKKAGKDPVRIMTTNYDERIDETEAQIHKYFGDLKSHSFRLHSLRSDESTTGGAVPLYSLNGQLKHAGASAPDPLIVGEADALTDHYQRRSQLMERALSESACLFIGSSLSEPDVLAKLVNTPYRFPRYAVVLTPELRLSDPDERARALNLVAQRFLHLGVAPVIIDFPHQAPQFLIEVALRLQQGSSYDNYPTRLENWWRGWAADFGFRSSNGREGGRRNKALLEAWLRLLERVRRAVIEDHLELPARQRDRDEQIQIEVWVRHPDERCLVHWATSEGLWLNANTAHRCFIHEGDEFAVQRAFRTGTPTLGPISPPRGRWRYQLSIPLVLRRHPWHHLPVGVVSVLSSKGEPERNPNGQVTVPGGRLGTLREREDFAKDLAKLAGDIKKPINELLDPRSPHCRRMGLGGSSRRWGKSG